MFIVTFLDILESQQSSKTPKPTNQTNIEEKLEQWSGLLCISQIMYSDPYANLYFCAGKTTAEYQVFVLLSPWTRIIGLFISYFCSVLVSKYLLLSCNYIPILSVPLKLNVALLNKW